VQDVVLALLAKGPSYGYELRQRLQAALGPWGAAFNAGQVYVTLGRLERAGLVLSTQVGQAVRPDRKVYELTAVAAAGLADPVAVADAQRRELLRRLRDVEQALLDEPDGSTAGLLLEGAVLHLQAGIRWLETCASHWATHRQLDESEEK